MFAKILIANRGEIAVRAACKEMGITPVAIIPTRIAPPSTPRTRTRRTASAGREPGELSQRANILAACRASADAVHPGYGFLAENAEFAQSL
jgi:acetyl-CoA/propionyl-CoA carboxylase biotin carboxyl carrier protein